MLVSQHLVFDSYGRSKGITRTILIGGLLSAFLRGRAGSLTSRISLPPSKHSGNPFVYNANRIHLWSGVMLDCHWTRHVLVRDVNTVDRHPIASFEDAITVGCVRNIFLLFPLALVSNPPHEPLTNRSNR